MSEDASRQDGPLTALTDPSPQAREDANPKLPPRLLDVDDVAAILRCSTRSVYRLVSSGRVPPPCRFGSMMRWTPASIEAWVAEGCPTVRRALRR